MEYEQFPIRCKDSAYYVEGYTFTLAGRKVGIAQNDDGAWTATDVRTGLALPVFEYYTEKEELVKKLKSIEDWLKTLYATDRGKAMFERGERELADIQGGADELHD